MQQIHNGLRYSVRTRNDDHYAVYILLDIYRFWIGNIMHYSWGWNCHATDGEHFDDTNYTSRHKAVCALIDSYKEPK